ncbi:MAG: hypothetical protein U0990_00215 [Candidatus Nanopelagicales bacterium]|nr:hypothetical protein [Candidatus Nanopelagicales bacterium]MDZ4248498.1 hypothetical protein [Candidatus Nanopelagicales bacterium]
MQQEARPLMLVNAASLASATILTSGLGVVFWALAARLYDPAGIGLANAQISSATLVATFASLNLGSMLLLYLPRAGRHTRWILVRAHVVVIALSFVAGALFVVLGLGEDYLSDPVSIAVFIVAVPSLAIFMEQAAILLAMGAGPAVTVENAVFAIAKMALLPVFAGLALASGIFASWIVPNVLVVVAVAYFTFGKLVPRQERAGESIELPPRRHLWPQMIKLYLSYVASQLTVLAIPLVIISTLGAQQNGYLTMAWLIGVAFGALIVNITQSFSQDVRKGHAITMVALKRLAVMLGVIGIGGGAITVIAAPLILHIMAPGYASASTGVLRLIGIAVPLQAIWLAMAAFLWLEDRIGWLAIGSGAIAAIAMGCTFVLAPVLGIASAGVGSLAGFGSLALVSIVPLICRVRRVKAGHGDDWVWTGDRPPTPSS